MKALAAFLTGFLLAIAAPAAPSNLSATPMSSSEIDLHWQDNALNEQGYKVQATTNTNGVWTQVAVLGAGASMEFGFPSGGMHRLRPPCRARRS